VGRSRKTLYVAVLVFPGYKTSEVYALLTEEQASSIAEWLNQEKKNGLISDYYLGPPQKQEQLHTQFLGEAALRAYFKDLIDLEHRHFSWG